MTSAEVLGNTPTPATSPAMMSLRPNSSSRERITSSSGSKVGVRSGMTNPRVPVPVCAAPVNPSRFLPSTGRAGGTVMPEGWSAASSIWTPDGSTRTSGRLMPPYAVNTS